MDRFTEDEAKIMQSAMCLHHHLLSSGYDLAKEIAPNAKTYTDVFSEFKEAKQKLISQPWNNKP